MNRFWRRAYVDDVRRVFCITEIDLGIGGYVALVGTQDDFKLLKEVLLADGYIMAQRIAFVNMVSV